MAHVIDTAERTQLYLALAKMVENPNATLTASQEVLLAQFLPGLAWGGQQGFPMGPVGDARGHTALRRTNWFNGRFLTAEALRRQDTYFDYRARLDAHLLMPGVAYGLGIEGQGLNGLPVHGDVLPDRGGFAASATLTLSPGLGFDHIGRPILVGQPFGFTLEQLVSTYRQTPRRVAPGGLEFAPCVCLVPDPEGPSGGAPAVRPGPYVLVIEAGETPEGEAKVYGEACAGPTPVTCQAEAWRGGFGLSLVRVPIELPEEDGLNTAWALRGTMSAWWFDVFEHSLIRRWDPTFAVDDGFTKPVGPGRHEAGAVALAMVWLGTDGSAIFLDRWIPRRSITATPGEDWHRTRFGAPPRAAAWARIHQFQAMLSESVALAPIHHMGAPNLWGRGFRHIPPIGFLPLDPVAIGQSQNDGRTSGNAMLDRLVEAGGGRIAFVSGMLAGARRQAFDYFAGTSVFAYCVVALHDDDILEDLSNAFDKDPVRVARFVKDRIGLADGDVDHVGNDQRRGGFVEALGRLFDVFGLDELVNRRTEIVKVILPLQGLSRPHPVVGVVGEDARNQAADWLGSPPPTWWTAAASLADAHHLARLRQSMPLDMLPRHFAVYVKQRMVLLDVLVLLIELLHAVVILARDVQRSAIQASPATGQDVMFTTQSYRLAYEAQPAERRAIAEAALAEPLIQAAVVQAAVLTAPELRVANRNQAFVAQVEARERELVDLVTDSVERQRVAFGQVADAYAAEHPGFQIMQIMGAVQPPAQAREVVREINVVANALPLRDRTTGKPIELTVGDQVLGNGPRVFAHAETTVVYAAMRTAVAEQPASDFVKDAPAGLTAREVLVKPPEEAAALLGGNAQLKAFTTAFQKETAAVAKAAEVVTTTPPPTEVLRSLAEAAAKGEDVERALEREKAAAGRDKQRVAYLEGAQTMLRTLGTERTLALARLSRGEGGG